MRPLRFTLVMASSLLLTHIAAAESLPWKAGAASAKITPEKSMWMAGYAARTEPSQGVELDLYAKALVLIDGQGEKFALVTLDLIGVPRDLRLNVAERVEQQYGIRPAQLTLNASHTHSGPELRTSKLHGVDDVAVRQEEAGEYTEQLQHTIVRMIGEALEQAVPAKLEYCSSWCGFAMNRRTPTEGGGWKNFPNPDGPVDHRVPVLKVTAADKRELAIVFGYACHCTTLGHQKFSGDYAGYAQANIEAAHPGTVALFMNGCSGDQNPYPRRTKDLAENHGRSLATAVEAALETTPKEINGNLRGAYREIPLAYDSLPTREQLLEEQQSKDKWVAIHATRLLQRIDEEGPLPKDYPYPVQVLRIGDQLTWVTLGGEVVVDYSHRLQRELDDDIVWVSGYSNDVMGYIPSLRVWQEGGYEGGGAMVYGTHPSRWDDQVEGQIVETVKELRRSLE